MFILSYGKNYTISYKVAANEKIRVSLFLSARSVLGSAGSSRIDLHTNLRYLYFDGRKRQG